MILITYLLLTSGSFWYSKRSFVYWNYFRGFKIGVIPGLVVFALGIIIITGCASASTPGRAPTPGGELSGGLLATFGVKGETFNVWITNPDTIRDLMVGERGTPVTSIPFGPVLPGAGLGDHNLPWSWHLGPDETTMVELASIDCDFLPSYVEQNLKEILEEVGYLCPSESELLVVTEYP
jgi:hypothetical protein